MHDPETRDKIRAAAHRRGKCPRCGGSFSSALRDGKDVGGMPGISYKTCSNCGFTAVAKSPRRKPKL